jgi:serine/threonine protein kinase
VDGSRDDKKLLDDYVLGEELGQGAFGVVYACTRRDPAPGSDKGSLGRAVKMVDKVETPVKEIKREAEILDRVHHRNIIRFWEVYYEQCFVCIVMDRYEGGDLIKGMQHHWESKGRIPCLAVKHVEYQCCLAIAVLHEKGIVHRDVKGDNYLLDRIDILDPNVLVVLTDFGTAIKCKEGERVRGAVGTKTYWSPEFYANDYGQKVDVWAFGVIVYGLLEGRFPFKDEETVRLKKPKLNYDLPPECVDFVRSLIKKEAERRHSGAKALEHQWLKGEGPPVQAADRPDDGGKEEEGDQGAAFMNEVNANAAVNRERRYELVERLEKAKASETSKLHFMDQSWDVAYRHQRKTVTFEWMPADKVIAQKIWNPDHGRIVSRKPTDIEDSQETASEACALFDRNAIEATLKEHGVDVSLFGVGEAKSLQQLVAEVKSGSSKLMVDAAEYKKLVRVCDLVLLRLVYKSVSGVKKFLLEVGEKFPDGRVRKELNRLPGTKKDPHENTKMVTQRIQRDLLGMEGCKITFDFKSAVVVEEEENSKSYPGVRTVYRKVIVDGLVCTSDVTLLRRIGAEGKTSEYSFTDSSGNTKFLRWLSESECTSLGVISRRRNSRDRAHMTSGLVMAPIGINTTALETYLAVSGVDTTKFGKDHARTLAEFAAELSNSEALLARGKDNKVIRMVDLVALKLTKEGTGEILVQAKEKYQDGTVKPTALLPGEKKLTQENQFQAAYRILDRLLQIPEVHVNLNVETVRIIEETKGSPSYPGMQTCYMKRIISGEVCGLEDLPKQDA